MKVGVLVRWEIKVREERELRMMASVDGFTYNSSSCTTTPYRG